MQKLKSFIVNKTEIVAAVFALALICVLVAFASNAVLFAVSFVLFVSFFVYAVYYYVVKYRFFPAGEGENLLEFSVDSLMSLSAPVLMINSNDDIAWHNDAFDAIKKDIGLKNGKSVQGVLGGALCYSTIKNNGGTLAVKFGDKHYELNGVSFSLKGSSYYLSFWKDVTKQFNAEDALKKKNVVIGYAAVDSADDVVSYQQSQYRTAIAVAYAELHTWVSGMKGVIREYDRDKYVIFVDEENFMPNIGTKFDILDRIENALAALQGQNIRLTFSMGFALVDGTLAEKEADAREALDYAFQRGGAQVIVRTRNANSSYGGQSRASAKTSKTKSRVTAERLKDLIEESSNVIIMGHKNIDVDAFASACAVARFAMLLEKPVNIVVNPNDGALEQFLPFLAELREYDNIFVDNVRGQELMSPKALVVIVDASNPKVFESDEIFKNATNLAIIDHHVQTKEFETQPTLHYIDPTASSASELMCEIIESVVSRGSGLKNPEKELLLAGILLDTQRFTRNTGVRTFGATMFLRPDDEMMLRARSLFKPTIDEYVKLSQFQKNAEMFLDVVGISYFDGDGVAENRIYASMAADNMLEVEGVKAAFAIATIGEDVHISGRSDGSLNVAKVLEHLGGGGRFDAAATLMKNTAAKDAKDSLKEAIEIIWNEKNTTGGTV